MRTVATRTAPGAGQDRYSSVSAEILVGRGNSAALAAASGTAQLSRELPCNWN
jgi:hypothetical protein